MNASFDPSPVFIAGPTAVGKSAVAFALAQQIGGEIISVDSMQVYRGLDIGTAKPTAGEQAKVRHHLIDVVDLTAPFDAAMFCALAKPAAAEIQARGRIPIFCGGTGLYFKAYLEGLGDAPPADENVRAELEKIPLVDLLVELKARDSVTFQRIDQRNPRRVIRALEVIRVTGKPFSEQRAKWEKATTPVERSGRLLGLARAPDDLKGRIHSRVDEMFKLGLVDETKRLLEAGLEQNKTAMQAIGYRQVVEHLRGERSLPDTIELIKTKTRQFSKRQMTWFRRQMDLTWLTIGPCDDGQMVAQRIVTPRT
jgi:tRNA dimethylallyltransferase